MRPAPQLARPSSHQSGNPQIRLMALTECGTHGLVDGTFDGVARASEHALARQLVASLQPDMLLLADRGFNGYELWGHARSTGAHLTWRIKGNQVFVPLRVLPDGSFISVMPTPKETVRHGQARAAGRTLAQLPEGHTARIIQYTVTVHRTAGPPRRETFRLVTSLLDHTRAPARHLAAIYHQRWEIENGYAELKNRLRGAGFVLRSKSPELACQEVYALLTVYQALCVLELHAAQCGGIDPDRISFTVTVQLARLKVVGQAAADAITLMAARSEVVRELLDGLLPTRRNRQCERVKKPPKNTFETKKRDRPRAPGHVQYTLKVTWHPPLPAETP
ncbi:IS4 family transposase [Kitasatospora sp. NPDC050543]|uniref:IS4 family transposase n=1 Tax=Kitasatospora sp. NPDC050543 TaxID=3364054 RepID=UPI0037929EB4